MAVETEGQTAMEHFADAIGVPADKLGPVEQLTRSVVDIASRCEDHLIEANRMHWYVSGVAPDERTLMLATIGLQDPEHPKQRNRPAEVRSNLVPTARGIASIGERLRIPPGYLTRLIMGTHRADAEPRAAAGLCNELLRTHNDRGKSLLVRLIDENRIRAVLSERYRIMDNLDLLGPFIRGISSWLPDRVAVDYADVDEEGMAVAITFPEALHGAGTTRQLPGGTVAVNDEYQAGFVLRNNECGEGGMEIVPRVWRVICSNGLLVEDMKFRRVHLGANLTGAMRDVMQQAVYEAIQHALDAMPRIVTALHEAQKERELNPIGRLGSIARHHDLDDNTRQHLFRTFAQEPEQSRFGVVQAITAAGRDQPVATDQQRLESLGGLVLQMPKREYERVYRHDHEEGVR